MQNKERKNMSDKELFEFVKEESEKLIFSEADELSQLTLKLVQDDYLKVTQKHGDDAVRIFLISLIMSLFKVSKIYDMKKYELQDFSFNFLEFLENNTELEIKGDNTND